MQHAYQLIEPCCGSAALSLHLLGARRSLMPYQGSKWRLRKHLDDLLVFMGIEGRPSKVVLTDPAPWGTVMGVLLDPLTREWVVDELNELCELDAKDVYLAFQGGAIPIDDVALTVQFLFLQRLAFSGKAVSSRTGVWRSPGFNKSSAYGTPATEKFGAISPMVPSLVSTLERYWEELHPCEVVSSRSRAQDTIPKRLKMPTVVYIDPEYVATTPYPDGTMSRADVIDLARAYRKLGAAVIISEGEMIPELMEQGWSGKRLVGSRDDESPFRGQQEEWVTFAK